MDKRCVLPKSDYGRAVRSQPVHFKFNHYKSLDIIFGNIFIFLDIFKRFILYFIQKFSRLDMLINFCFIPSHYFVNLINVIHYVLCDLTISHWLHRRRKNRRQNRQIRPCRLCLRVLRQSTRESCRSLYA